MKNKTLAAAALTLVSAFIVTSGVKAEDTVVEPVEIQTQDTLQTRDRLRHGTGEKLQAKDLLEHKADKGAGNPAAAEKDVLKYQEKTRLMQGTGNSKGEAVSAKAENAAEAKLAGDQEKEDGAVGQALKTQERKQERKQLRTKDASCATRGVGAESRKQNRGAGKRR